MIWYVHRNKGPGTPISMAGQDHQPGYNDEALDDQSSAELQAFLNPPPTLAQQALALLNAGCQIASAGTSALNGTYPTDLVSQAHVNAEVTSLLLNGSFADGSSEIAWLDISEAPHTFSIAQFKALATALALFVSGATKVVNGTSSTLPTQPAPIA